MEKENFKNNNLFSVIDSEEKAYWLGHIAGSCIVTDRNNGELSFDFNHSNKEIEESFFYFFKENLSLELVTRFSETYYEKYFIVKSLKLVNDIIKLLGISTTDNRFRFERYMKTIPTFSDKNLSLSFLCGFFEANGEIYDDRELEIHFEFENNEFMSEFNNFFGIKCDDEYGCVNLNNNNALEFLHKFYGNENVWNFSRKKEKIYFKWCKEIATLRKTDYEFPVFRFSRKRPDAVAPFKTRVTDSGYDLVLLEKVNQIGNVEFYDTGISVSPPFGWYFDLVPRSSISKSGYILANSVGIIDRTYTGNVIVPLIKINKNAEDLKLPNRLVQLIPRPIVHFEVKEIEELDSTERGTGGFGSTNK